MKERLDWLGSGLGSLSERGLLRERRTVAPLPRGRCRVGQRTLLNFSTNDYLDLAGDPRLIEAARAALDESGTGAQASALVAGRTDWHARLEQRLAEFERQPAAVLFPTGYAANVGTIAALAGPGDAIFCDRLNHASLIDGSRLSGAKLRIYRHENSRTLDTLKRELAKAAHDRRRWIVTDSVFSMDGDLAPLVEMCDLAECYDAAVIVDEAHATGVFGAQGRGVAELLGVEDRIAVRIGTLSKAAGGLGGFVAGPQPLVNWLWNTARTQMFSTALPPGVCAAAAKAIDVIEAEPWRRSKLQALSQRLQHRLRDWISGENPATGDPARPADTPHPSSLIPHQPSSFLVPHPLPGPIIPVVVGSAERAVAASRALEDRGFLVPAIRPPTVPEGTARLRISLSCGHEECDVDALAEALSAAIEA